MNDIMLGILEDLYKIRRLQEEVSLEEAQEYTNKAIQEMEEFLGIDHKKENEMADEQYTSRKENK